MNSSIIHGRICSLIHKKCHPKSCHSDIEYHMILNILFGAVTISKRSVKVDDRRRLHDSTLGKGLQLLAKRSSKVVDFTSVSTVAGDAEALDPLPHCRSKIKFIHIYIYPWSGVIPSQDNLLSIESRSPGLVLCHQSFTLFKIISLSKTY